MIKIPLFGKRKLKLYETISELPAENWFLIHEKNELSHLAKNQFTEKEYIKNLFEFERAWDKIYCEFLDTFGLPDEFRAIWELRAEIEALKIERVVNDDLSKETDIEIAEKKLSQKLKKDKDTSFRKVKYQVKKHMGFNIDFKQISVKEFYELLESINEDNKEAKRAAKRNKQSE